MHTPEKTIQNAILREFGTRADMRLFRMNVGKFLVQGKWVSFGVPGQADLSGILPGGIRLEVEVKTASGKQSEDQQRWQRMIEKFGGVYVLARSVEDVWAAVRKYLI